MKRVTFHENLSMYSMPISLNIISLPKLKYKLMKQYLTMIFFALILPFKSLFKLK